MRGSRIIAGLIGLMTLGVALAADPKSKPYRLPSVDIKQPIIWGATCELPDGTGLAFGGQDQTAEEAGAWTALRQDGKWLDIRAALRGANPRQAFHSRCAEAAVDQAKLLARARRIWFVGGWESLRATATREELEPKENLVLLQIQKLQGSFAEPPNPDAVGEVKPSAIQSALNQAERTATEAVASLGHDLNANGMGKMWDLQRQIEQAAELLDAEPAARALSPIVYDARSGRYVVFGGDHCDYLTNDTWLFDPKARRWERSPCRGAPPPRANHKLVADANGRIHLSGGYTYANSTDYTGGQYVDHNDGEWVYEVAEAKWTSVGGATPVAANQRTYRTGPFLPHFFLQGPTPDAAAFQQRLKDLPVNTWVSIKPPQLPQLNRDWGSATLDPDGDQILRFAGGHSAHGGTDVLHFHLATGRWELPFPVEFPLGQLYTNTDYPAGWNLNHRPWITGHTYQSYAYEPLIKQMVFTGQQQHSYFYDPARADWVDRIAKPKGMTHGDCFYDLTLCQTPKGLCCWTKDGEVFRLDPTTRQWHKLAVNGVKLAGSRVDNSTALYDSKRDRLLMLRKEYGDQHLYDGVLYALDLKTLEASRIEPTNAPAAAKIPYLCQLRYSPTHDLVLAGCTLPPDENGVRRTPAYDPAANQWISLKITGDDPSGPKGRNVSLGLMHDPKRDLFWAVDAKSNVFVLKLDPSKAESAPLK